MTVGSQPFPVGVETLVQLFEPWLLRDIDLDHFNALRQFLASRALKYSGLAAVKASITANIPPTFPAQERAAFLADLNNTTTTTTVVEAMELYLGFVGKKNFDRVFPP